MIVTTDPNGGEEDGVKWGQGVKYDGVSVQLHILGVLTNSSHQD